METIQIKGAKRENFGKKGSKDVRREGRVPVSAKYRSASSITTTFAFMSKMPQP